MTAPQDAAAFEIAALMREAFIEAARSAFRAGAQGATEEQMLADIVMPAVESFVQVFANRTQAWSYRGPLAIHAGQRLVRDAFGLDRRSMWPTEAFPTGAIIGIVDLVDAHVAQPEHIGDDGLRRPFCCDSPWAETSYAEHGGRTRRDVVHLVLANPRPLEQPISCKGRLGLWTPPTEVLEQIQAVAS